MKFKADRKELLAAINRVVGGVDKRSTIPILSHILIDASTRGTVQVSASDLSTHITTSLKVGITGETGSACVPGDKIKSALDKLHTDIIQVELKNQRLTITGDDSLLELSTLAGDEFPLAKNDDISHHVGTLPGGYLRRALNAVGHAISGDENKHNLTGLHLCIDGDNLTTVAADGHRLSLAGVNNNQYDLPAGMTLPLKAAKLISSLDCNQQLYHTGHGLARFLSDREHGTDIHTSLIDSDFPEYRRVIPQHKNAILVDSDKLSEALELCGIVADGPSKAVSLDLQDHTLTVSALSDTGISRVVLPAQNDDAKTLNIKINSKYILQAISALDSTELFIKFDDGRSALVLVPVDNEYWDERLEVLMPVR